MEEIEQTIESSEKKSNWGGARPNSGRPLGSMNKATREQKEAEEYFRQRVLNSIEEIVNSQMNLAKGTQMLFRIDEIDDGKGKKIKQKPELVTNQEEIERYLAGDLEDKDSYYFITTERPDNKAIDSLIDRVFGKASQKLEVSGKDGQPIVVLCDPIALERFNKNTNVPPPEPTTGQ